MANQVLKKKNRHLRLIKRISPETVWDLEQYRALQPNRNRCGSHKRDILGYRPRLCRKQLQNDGKESGIGLIAPAS